MRFFLIASGLLLVLLALSCNKAAESEKQANQPSSITIGDQAPQFSLPGYPDQEFSLADYQGRQVVVLYFYPKDNTPDCTTEACSFRDTAMEFANRGATIVGVSRDDLASHALFADEYSLPFPLLSDRDNSVREMFGNPDGSTPLESRITYVIDRQGIVREIISGRDALMLSDHITRSLEAVKKLAESTA